jgi:hypothetical protein
MATEPRHITFVEHLEVAKKYVNDPQKQLDLHDEMMRCTGSVVQKVIDSIFKNMVEIELSRDAYVELHNAVPPMHRFGLSSEEREHLLLGRIKFIPKESE